MIEYKKEATIKKAKEVCYGHVVFGLARAQFWQVEYSKATVMVVGDDFDEVIAEVHRLEHQYDEHNDKYKKEANDKNIEDRLRKEEKEEKKNKISNREVEDGLEERVIKKFHLRRDGEKAYNEIHSLVRWLVNKDTYVHNYVMFKSGKK